VVVLRRIKRDMGQMRAARDVKYKGITSTRIKNGIKNKDKQSVSAIIK